MSPLEVGVALVPHRGFPSMSKGGQPMPVVPLRVAIETHFEEDAHFVGYHVEDADGRVEPEWPRLRKRGNDLRSLEQQGRQVFASLLAFDYDRPKKDGAKQPWESPEEPAEILERLIEAGLLPTVFYSTKHGARLVYVLDTPVPVARAEEAYRVMLGILQRAGVACDTGTADWSRLFRLPYVTPEGATPLWEESFIWHETFEGELLSIDWVLGKTEEVERLDLEGSECPERSLCDDMLEAVTADGKVVQTDLVRQAKKRLQGSPHFDIIFHRSMPPWVEGERNTGLWKLVGHVVARLWGGIEDLTHVHVFALLRPIAERMPPSDDDPTPYVDKLWDMVCRTWEKRHEDVRFERLSFEQEAERALVGFREQARADGKSLEIVAAKLGATETDVMRDHLIAVASSNEVYLLDRDGYYTTQPVGTLGLHGAIRAIGAPKLYDMLDERGELVPADALIRRHGFAIAQVRQEVGAENGYLRDLESPTPTLVLPSYHLIHEPNPEFVREVDLWLRALAGDEYERLVDWLAFAQQADRPICALSLVGGSNAGKTFLAELLGARFGPGKKNGDAAMTQYNAGIAANPVIHVDEGVAFFKGNSKAPDELLRTYITGGNLELNQKYMRPRVAEAYPRLVIAANNVDALRTAIGWRDLDNDSYAALTSRILHIQVCGHEAATYLKGIGGRKATDNWMKGERLALRHLAWLYENRPAVSRWAGSRRLLVEGVSASPDSAGSRLIESMRWASPQSEAVIRVVLRATRFKKTTGAQTVFESPEFPDWILVSSNGAFEYVKNQMDLELRSVPNLTMRTVKRVLQSMGPGDSEGVRLSKEDRRRVWRVDPAIVVDFALAHGMDPSPVKAPFIAKYGEQEWEAVLEGGEVDLPQSVRQRLHEDVSD